jgi:hypothetical protein
MPKIGLSRAMGRKVAMLVGISPVGFGLMCLLIGAGLALVAWPIAYPTVERLLEHNRELTTQIQRLATQQGDNSLVITPPTARHAGTVTRMGTREDEADILKRLMDLLFAPPRRWDSAIDNGVVRRDLTVSRMLSLLAMDVALEPRIIKITKRHWLKSLFWRNQDLREFITRMYRQALQSRAAVPTAQLTTAQPNHTGALVGAGGRRGR